VHWPQAHAATFPESQTVAAGQPARVFFVETTAHRPPTSDQLILAARSRDSFSNTQALANPHRQSEKKSLQVKKPTATRHQGIFSSSYLCFFLKLLTQMLRYPNVPSVTHLVRESIEQHRCRTDWSFSSLLGRL